MIIESGIYELKGIDFKVYATDDPSIVSVLLKQAMPPEVTEAVQDQEEAFFEITGGSFSEHPFIRHFLIHMDSRPDHRNAVYQIVTHPKDLETAQELALHFKYQIKDTNDWGDTSCMVGIPIMNTGSKN